MIIIIISSAYIYDNLHACMASADLDTTAAQCQDETNISVTAQRIDRVASDQSLEAGSISVIRLTLSLAAFCSIRGSKAVASNGGTARQKHIDLCTVHCLSQSFA
jgi:hypothetical protein